MTRRRLLLLAAFLVAVLAGCRVDGVVEVAVDKDGSGTVSVGVSLDDEAQAVIPDLADQLRLDDLRAAGWEVSGPALEEDGLLWIRATKRFVDAPHFSEIMDELSDGVIFRDFRLDRSRSFATTRYEVSGTVDWTGGVAAFGDPALTQSLLGVPLGYEQAELEALAGGPVDQRTELRVDIRLPDDAQGNAEQLTDSTGTWIVRPDDRTVTRIELEGTVEDTAPRVWAAVAIITGGLAVILVLVGVVGAVLRRLRRPARRPVRTRRHQEIVEAPPASAPEKRARRLELVVLGGTGVVFDAGDGDQGLLVPFVRAANGTASAENIAACHRAASLGRMTAAEFWREVGADGDPDELDRAYLARIRLMPGLPEFLARVTRRQLRVACLTNAVLAWSLLLRERYDLGRIDPWIVSAEVGARKPSRAMFEALRRTTGVPFENCLLIDSNVAALEAGRKLGMSTVWFAPTGARVPEGFPHVVVRGFDELLGATVAPAP